MKKKTKMFSIFTAILCVATSLAGCGNNGTISTPSGSTIKSNMNIEDIDWKVDEGIVDGDRFVLLSYTNNTPYTITSFELTFKEKSTVSEEERESFFSDIQQNLNVSDEDIEEVKNRQITMHTHTERVVEPGESISNVNCYYYSGIYYLKDINHYNLVEPDIATIKYIDEDQIYTVYYDYGSNSYSAEEDTEIAYQWSETDLGDMIPKPDVKVVESGRDDEDIFMFDAYGLTLEEFNDYVEECKELGYTIDPGSFEGFYSADNEEGYNVYLYYDDIDHSMSGRVEPPETNNE